MQPSLVPIPDRSPIREYLFNSIWFSSIDGIRVIDDQCRIIKVNPAYCRLVNKTEEELIGSRFNDVYTGELSRVVLDDMMRSISAGTTPDTIEREYTLWDGSKKWFEISSSLIEPEPGKRYVESIVRDRTEHRRKDRELELAEEHFRLLYENAPLSYQSLDEEGKILNVNPTWLHTLGYEREEVIGRKFADFVPKEFSVFIADTFHLFMQKGEIHNVEFEMMRKDGSNIFVNYEGKIAFDDAGAFKQTHCIFSDITQKKKAEAELRKLNIQTRKYAHLKDELLNEVNHRVKNNLMTILGLILAEKRRPVQSLPTDSNEKWEEFELRINGLLKVHQMLSDSQWGPLNISDLVQKILGGVISIYEPVVTAAFHVEPSEIVISPRQANNLALVMNELSTNSMKHAFAGVPYPEVFVTAWTEGDNICIEFRDNGRGYPDDVLMKNRENVGLHLVKQIVQETLRGKVKLSNRNGAVAMIIIKTEEVSRT
jgi:PAS domain S-box-containing protein